MTYPNYRLICKFFLYVYLKSCIVVFVRVDFVSPFFSDFFIRHLGVIGHPVIIRQIAHIDFRVFHLPLSFFLTSLLVLKRFKLLLIYIGSLSYLRFVLYVVLLVWFHVVLVWRTFVCTSFLEFSTVSIFLWKKKKTPPQTGPTSPR